jgi:hypothetical protein
MARVHPHVDATYRLVARQDNTFGIDVLIPGMNLTRVMGFATEASAAAWITKHQREVEEYVGGWVWRKRPSKR